MVEKWKVAATEVLCRRGARETAKARRALRCGAESKRRNFSALVVWNHGDTEEGTAKGAERREDVVAIVIQACR